MTSLIKNKTHQLNQYWRSQCSTFILDPIYILQLRGSINIDGRGIQRRQLNNAVVGVKKPKR